MNPSERPPILHEGMPTQLPDIDPDETADWVASLNEMIQTKGRERARYVMLRLLERAREKNIGLPALRSTDFINTIPPEREPDFPGDEDIERRIRSMIRWNAAVMVARANRPGLGVGGHIATYQSAASLYEVGFNHFFRGRRHPGGGDQIYVQGHAAPGIYARSYLEGRLSEDQLDHFRQERSHGVGNGLSSYPHPRLMPDYWEFPTVSMGLAAINAIYQARFNRYLQHRGIKDTSQQHVWAFLGDGEMGEPESLGAIRIAAREELDNLTFVVNCNLQQLDGPVTGNGKIIQELEAYFRGAGWNVIKVVWGQPWDDLLARDTDGVLVNQMNRVPDGEFQTLSVESGAYNREHFFGPDPRLQQIVAHLSDEQIETSAPRRPRLPQGVRRLRLGREAHRPADRHPGAHHQGLADRLVQGQNATHQMKKLTRRRPEGVPRQAVHPDHRPADRRGQLRAAVLPPGRRQRRDPVHAGSPRSARRTHPVTDVRVQAAQVARRPGLRRARAGFGQAGRSPRRWRSSGCSRSSCATRRSATASSRSRRTSTGRSAWTRCSRRPRSTTRTARTTTRSTASCCSPTRSPRRASSCTRASAKPAPWHRPPPPAARTPPTTSR